MPRAQTNGIEIEYETFGDPEDPTMLLVMGLGSQMILWDDALCRRFADEGFHVVRFDNRDIGLSTKIESTLTANLGATILAAFAGQEIESDYLLADMAADAFGLLDHLGFERAHVVGASMGGMIAQTMAITCPERVITLTSIMSTTGNPEVGRPNEAALPLLIRPPAKTLEQYIDLQISGERVLNGDVIPYDPERARRRAERCWERGYHPAGTGRQLLAILASGDRTDALRELDVPTLVVHGDVDPLVDVSGGYATAEAVPGARLVIIPGLGHNLPVAIWDRLVTEITEHTRSAEGAAA